MARPGTSRGGPIPLHSIACSPQRASETRTLELLIALEADGTLGPHLPETTARSVIEVEGPLGTFFFPADAPEMRLLFVAGGPGSRRCGR